MDSNKPTTVTFQPGELVIKENTACEALYIIKEGQLEVSKTSGAGEKIIIGLISSGQYAGETALLFGRMNTSNVTALTPVTAVKLSRSSIEAQLKTVPSWLIALTKGLIERLNSANEILKRNGLTDENLANRVRAMEEKFKKAQGG